MLSEAQPPMCPPGKHCRIAQVRSRHMQECSLAAGCVCMQRARDAVSPGESIAAHSSAGRSRAARACAGHSTAEGA